MEAMIPEIIEQFGISAIPALIVFLILYSQIRTLERSFAKHVEHHKDFEDKLLNKCDKIYDRLNPLNDLVNRIWGKMEAKNDKS